MKTFKVTNTFLLSNEYLKNIETDFLSIRTSFVQCSVQCVHDVVGNET